MYSIFKKEIYTFLGSLTGYLAVLVFLLITGLFLWVFPGAYNIPDAGYSTLEPFFSLAPWLYLFLVPAITMRFFAEEKRSGTIEILLTRPVTDFKLVLAKFLAALLLVIFSLLPTLLYFLSVYLLGNPAGNIDTGATWGAFAGLFFMATIYVAIGLFASSLTDNQIVSFITGMLFSFVFFLGFDFIASAGVPYMAGQILSWLSIQTHNLSVSRGVIDMRDMIYFLGMTIFFLYLTSLLIRKGKWKQKRIRGQFSGFIFVLLIIFFVSGNFLFRIDLTSDKRYSLSPVSARMVSGFEHPAEVELFLSGRLEPGLQKLRQEIIEKIAVLNVYAEKPIRLKITDPYGIGNSDRRNRFIQEIADKGIVPTRLNQRTEQGVSSRLIFPGALVRYNGKETAVNFLKSNPDFSPEANLNHSAESVEFELISSFQKLMRRERPVLAFLEGHGEYNTYEVKDVSDNLRGDFQVIRVTVNDLKSRMKDIRILVVAGPQIPFTEQEKLVIDQFVMYGGKVMWLIDPVQVNADSLASGYQTFAFPRNLNLDDQLFRYGVRLNYELLQDVYCARIKVNTAMQGSPPQFTLHPWYYSPLLVPGDNHPATRHLNAVFTEFVSSLDTVSGNPECRKSIILSTSPNARRVKSPSSVSLENINNPPARELFNEAFIPVGAILEGKFTSVFRNRIVDTSGFPEEIKDESVPGKMVVVADGGLIANRVNYSTQPPGIAEAGNDRVSGITFGNREFLLNLIFYLNDEEGIMQLRNRSLSMRLLDKVRVREEKIFWQWLNVAAPLAFVVLLGLIFHKIRRYRFARV